MNGPCNELEMFEISDLGRQLEDFAFWFEWGPGQACLSTISSLKFTVVS